jgi:anti-anti-sigma factor
VLRLSGEIDTSTVARYQASLGAAESSDVEQVIAVDARQVTFLNSTGLGLLIRSTLACRESGHSPVLLGPRRAVLQVLKLTGTTALFRIR